MVLHTATLEIIVLFKGKVGAKFKTFGRPRPFYGPLHPIEKV